LLRFNLAKTILAAAVVGSMASAQVAVNDVFNRADSSDLGPDWVQVSSGASVRGNQLVANTSLYGWARHTAFDAPYASTVVRFHWSMSGSPAGDSWSLIVGAPKSTWGGIEVKIGDNQGYDDKADRILFYSSPNGGNWPGGGNVYNLAQPMASGTMTVWFTANGDTVNVELVDDATGAVETTSASGILSFPFSITGRSVGIGYFGDGACDDFRAWTGTPAGPVFTLTTPRSGLPASFLVTDASPSMPVETFVSLAGNGPLPTPFGLLRLSVPFYSIGSLVTDGAGRAEMPLAFVPPFPGVNLYLQAIDVGSLTFTNAFVAPIQ